MGLGHSGIALIMLLLYVKMFDDSLWLNQVHILQIGFSAPKIWPLVETTALFFYPEARSFFLVGALKILYGYPFPPLPKTIWIGWH